MPKKIEKKSLTLFWYSCLNVHQGIYWVNSRFGTPIIQILGHYFFIPQGRNRKFKVIWGDEKLVIAGSDILGRPLRGIVKREASAVK